MVDAKYSKEFTEELERQENELLDQDDSSILPPNDIVAFNELRSCADLVRMYKTNQLIIQPDFQRDVVWPKPAQTRFIDSLIKQLPIPSMCLSLDYNTGERLMIDGLQRISSIIFFLTDDRWRLSSLTDIDPRISGKTVEQIKDKHYELFSRLENLTIPVTVLRCDYKKKSHMNYLFTIFHRLNTGGNKLNNQEIRNCIFHGNFNSLLRSLTEYTNFRNIFKIEDKTYRFAFEEMILRFFAFNEQYEQYNGKLANFLNDYMDENKTQDEKWVQKKRLLFERTINLLYVSILGKKPMPNLSKTTTEAVLVGISRNLKYLETLTSKELSAKFKELRKDENFSVENLKEGLSQKDKVIRRLDRAIEIFAA